MIVQVCVGSSCYLRGSNDIIEMLQKAVKEHQLETDITLVGSFCSGKCNRIGVTITIDDVVYSGITRENFKEFFNENIFIPVKNGCVDND